VSLAKDGRSAAVEFQGRTATLTPGTWSGWQEVSFNLGLFKTMKGIFKFYLVETEPGFKLYISPINFDPRAPYFPISYPGGYSAELAKTIGLYHTMGMPMDTWAVNELRLTEAPFLEQAEEIFLERKKMLEFELGRCDKGVFFCYFETPDIIQHMFWRCRDAGHPLYDAQAAARHGETIAEWYRKTDAALGTVMERCREGDTLIVLSDHGVASFRRSVHLNAWLRDNGYLALKGAGTRSGGELLADIDWPKTRAYAIGFGAIYINMKGRERDGAVAQGAESDALAKEIAAKLGEWRDEKTGEPVTDAVFARGEIFRGPFAKDTPDLYVGFSAGYRASWQTAVGATPEALIEDNLKKWSGDHLFSPQLIPGALFTNRKIAAGDPSLYDIAPTVLALAGFSEDEIASCDFDGRDLFH
ncbi:MAG TPA: alkaline phosphatase family protein, partial [bacterium]|nr:alkaline phosphatase family protein [bacterium]